MLKETFQKLSRSRDGFCRFWIGALLVFSLGYTPVHLIVEPHGGEHVELANHEHNEGADHHAEEDHAGDEGESHAHHHENEHAVSAVAPAKAKLDTLLICVAIIAVQTISFDKEISNVRFALEADIPPESSPPSPLQPRAPPLA